MWNLKWKFVADLWICGCFVSILLKKNLISFFFAGTFELDLQGPVFSHEPPHKVEFSNNTGGHIGCSGHGSPQPEVSI